MDWLALLRMFENFGQAPDYSQSQSYRTPPFVPNQPLPGMGQPTPTFGSQANDPTLGPDFQPPPPPDYNKMWQDMYQPRYEMQDRFKGMLDQFPQRESPSGWRRLGAIATGLGEESGGQAFKAAHTVANQPYFDKLGDWTAQANPLLKAVDDERAYNQTQAQSANWMMQRRLQDEQNQIRQQDADTRERAQLARAKVDQDKLDLENKKYELQVMKAQMPSLRFFVGDDSYVWYVDSKNPQSTGRTDVKSNQIDPRTRLAIQLQNSKDLALFNNELITGRIKLRDQLSNNAGQLSPAQVEQVYVTTIRQMLIDHPDWKTYLDQSYDILPDAPPEIQQAMQQYITSRAPRYYPGGGGRAQSPEIPGMSSPTGKPPTSPIPQVPGQVPGQFSSPRGGSQVIPGQEPQKGQKVGTGDYVVVFKNDPSKARRVIPASQIEQYRNQVDIIEQLPGGR